MSGGALASGVSQITELDSTGSHALWRDVARRLVRHRLAMFGAVILLIVMLLALFGPILTPYDPNGMDFTVRFASPSLQHPMGTDDFGRDILARVIYGAQISLKVSLIAVAVATAFGTTFGVLAGYGNRILDEIIMRSMDILYAFPAILLAIAVMAALGKGENNAMIAIGLVYIPIFARIARGAVLSVRNEDYVLAARALGAGHRRIILMHIMPNILSPIIVEITLSLAFAILAEASLSFFGLGKPPPDPSWGRMLAESRDYFRQSSWMSLFPGIAIFLTVMGFNFLGDGLRDALDPRLKR